LTGGHSVTAYVHTPSKLSVAHSHLTVIEGELDDPVSVTRAVEDAEAVISGLGSSLKRGVTGTPVAEGTRTIVKAMEASGVRRFVGLASPSVADERDRPTLKAKVLPVMARLMFPNALTELAGMTEAVTGSDLDWTIGRITSPNDKPPRARSVPASSAATRSDRR
jgi:putative NADH-flavin reductase